MSPNTGKLIIFAGLTILIIGVVVYFFGDKLNWLGRLPGDIRVEKENFRFFFPITTTILLSAILNILVWLARRFLQ